jgi:hypothetical protein
MTPSRDFDATLELTLNGNDLLPGPVYDAVGESLAFCPPLFLDNPTALW